MELEEPKSDKKPMIVGIISTIVVLALFIGLSWFLYTLGGADQPALTRLRDIAIIFIVLLFTFTVVLLAGVVFVLF